MNLQWCAAAAVVVVCLSGDASASETTPEPAVLSLGAERWSAQGFAWLLEAGGAPDALDAQQLAAFVDNFSERRLLARAAEAAGVAADPRVAQKLALARDRILAEAERERLRERAPIDAAAVRADFDAHPDSFDEIRLSHILVRVTANDEALPPAQRRTAEQAHARAVAVHKQLKSGAHFAALARKHSDDTASRGAGGQLPVMFVKDLKPEVASAVKALQPGQLSAAVRGADGYHLIRLEEKSVASFEDSRRLREFTLRDAWAEAQLRQLRAAAPTSFDLDAWLVARERVAARP